MAEDMVEINKEWEIVDFDVDWEWNGKKLRKDHGANWPAITFDIVNQFLPVVAIFILWQYLKQAIDEASGKKK